MDFLPMAGLIHVYCGDGKGKTTAAVGLAVRACGAGKKVLFVQFLKSDASCERRVLEQLEGVELAACPSHIKFTFRMNEQEKQDCRQRCAALLQFVQNEIASFGCVVLDEIFPAVSAGMLGQQEVLQLMANKPHDVELVLTGRSAFPAAIEAADYVTEMKKIRHPYDYGVPARKGVEF